MIRIKYYDIDEQLAEVALHSWSFSTYQKNSSTNEYREKVDHIYEMANKIVEEKPELEQKAEYWANKFAKLYADWINKKHRLESSCPSMMIAGPSNFPTQKKEKQSKQLSKHFLAYDYIMAIETKIQNLPRTMNIIRTDTPNAIKKLQKEIESLKTEQNLAKKANQYYKKHHTLIGSGPTIDPEKQITEELAQKWIEYIQYAGVPAPTFYLTSLRNKIKRMESKIVEIEKLKIPQKQEVNIYPEQNLCKVVENKSLMRIQLEFDGKPNIAVRYLLKHYGYHWSPRNQVWQRQLTVNAKYATKELLMELKNM